MNPFHYLMNIELIALRIIDQTWSIDTLHTLRHIVQHHCNNRGARVAVLLQSIQERIEYLQRLEGLIRCLCDNIDSYASFRPSWQ